MESKARLGDRLPRPVEKLTRTREEAEAFARDLGAPLVAKACGVPHKTESGLVRKGLDCASLGKVWEELARSGDGTVLVVEQIEAELELMVGGYRDESFGPVVTIGIGGIAIEVFYDLVAVLSPPEPGEVTRPLARLRGYALLEEYRGRPRVDLAALETIVSFVASLLDQDHRVVEVDCNPVMVAAGRRWSPTRWWSWTERR